MSAAPVPGSLDRRVAVVTGGGRGIGRAHCLLLAARGARVVVCDVGAGLDGSGHDRSVADAVVSEIRAEGGDAVADHSDISTFDGAARPVARAVQTYGRIDIVVNNAGIAAGGGDAGGGDAGGGDARGGDAGAPIETITEDELDEVFAVNFTGTIGTTRAAWPYLRAQGWGRIVNTVSEVALDTRIPGGGGVGYGAAKAAVWSATLSLAQQGAQHGITVNAVSPGASTRMNEEMFRYTPPPAGLDLDPVHVARVVAWLVSDDAADVTGRIVHVTGGQHREYTTRRHRDTELVQRIDRAVADASR
ncbi:MAG: SDR family NAD(P)-dependent oxidoreductase [Acidimicrobiia bacterium]